MPTFKSEYLQVPRDPKAPWHDPLFLLKLECDELLFALSLARIRECALPTLQDSAGDGSGKQAEAHRNAVGVAALVKWGALPRARLAWERLRAMIEAELARADVDCRDVVG
jgi:hypothetical protein